MIWKCKYCEFNCDQRGQILKHYRIKHGSYSRNEPFPCPHQDCLCTFRSFGTLRTHMSRFHIETPSLQPAPRAVKLRCLLCEFLEPCNDATYFTHLRSRHLRDNQKVQCPFKGCTFESSVYSTFNAHKSKVHRDMTWTTFKSEIVVSTETEDDKCSDCDDTLEINVVDTAGNLDDDNETPEAESQHLWEDLEHNLAALFLKMQTVLHVPEKSVQEVIQQLCDLVQLSQAPLYSKVKMLLQKHHTNVDESVVREVVDTLTGSNIITACCGKDGCLATIKRRASYVLREFPLVMPIEYVVEKGRKTVAYVPLLQMLQKMLNKQDVFKKTSSTPVVVPNEFNTCRDGKWFRENDLLCSDELTLALNLYIDDFEVANPLGTSKGKHKMCAVYWTIANIPAKYRSTLHSIQLALLCNTTTIKECGYEKALYPLISDLVSLEQNGVYIEHLGRSVKGTVLFVSADNLGAHSLAGFYESFSVDKFCRFCMASRSEAQEKEVCSGAFQLRDRDTHNTQVQETLRNPTSGKNTGVKGLCPLTANLKFFHAIGGYPPDPLHDILEGIVPIELSLCIADLVAKKCITLDVINEAIKTFPYACTDKTDRPQPIVKGFDKKGTIGGNGHENWCLIRLLPLLIGHCIPEGNDAWDVLMLLKDIVALALAPRHTSVSVYLLQSKVAEHRELLQSTFPGFRLRPKHHYIEHYSELIKLYGPLCEVWTMRFEGKHKFFKKVVQDAQNFKNVPMTLAVRHQKAVSYQLDCSSFYKPEFEMTKVTSLLVTSFPESIQNALRKKVPNTSAVLTASSICIDGIEYNVDSVLSAGSCSGLPEFKQITQIIAVNTNVLFICQVMTAWYSEQLRSYELCIPDSPTFCILQLTDLNDPFPLSPYNVQGKLMVTVRHFIHC